MLTKFFTDNTDRIIKNVWLFFMFVVVINIVFRLFYLGEPSYWYDEIISIKAASEDFGHIKHVSEWDNNPPFYYYCLSVWIKLFNDSEFVSRLLSVIFSALSGGLLFVFTNKYFNKTAAILVSVLYLSSNFIYFYSHETRAYSLVVLLVLLSSYLFFALKDNLILKNVLLLGLINFLLIYTHYIVGIVLVFQWFFVMLSRHKTMVKKYAISTLIVIALVLLRFTKKQFLLIVGFNKPESKFWLQKSDISLLFKTLSEFFFHPLLIIPLLLIIGVGVIFIIKAKDKNRVTVFLYSLTLGLVSVILVYVLGKITPLFLDRYLIFSIPFICIAVAATLSYVRYRGFILALSGVFFIISAFNIDYRAEKSMNYRGAVNFIKENINDKSLIIVKTKDLQPLFSYYYEKDYLKLKKKQLDEKNILFCTMWADVSVNVDDFERIIVVDAFYDLNPYENEFIENINQHKHNTTINNTFKGVRITTYE